MGSPLLSREEGLIEAFKDCLSHHLFASKLSKLSLCRCECIFDVPSFHPPLGLDDSTFYNSSCAITGN